MTNALAVPSSPHIRGMSPSHVRLEQTTVQTRLVNPRIPPGRRKMLVYFAGMLTFVVLALTLQFLYTVLHDINENGEAELVLPTSIENVKRVHRLLMVYTDSHYVAVILGISVLYVVMLTFAIPGTIFLSILNGALFGLWQGLFMCIALATVGGTTCYYFSKYAGNGVILRMFPDLVEKFRKRIDEHRDNLHWYLLFLRMTPLLPNWFISLASPWLNVPYRTFIFATSLGLIPGHYLCVKAGLILSELTSTSDIFDLPSIIGMFCVACLALIPVVFKKRLEKVL